MESWEGVLLGLGLLTALILLWAQGKVMKSIQERSSKIEERVFQLLCRIGYLENEQRAEFERYDPPWRSLATDNTCYEHERIWVSGPRLPVLPKFICLDLEARPAEYFRSLGFTHWMPIEDWPLPPAPEGAA